MWVLGIGTGICYIIDQATKYLFYTEKFGTDIPFITTTLNTGISRGIQIPMRIIICFTGGCAMILIQSLRKKWITREEFILFCSGMLGNLTDRIYLGGVRDFIAIGSFPIFNMADVFLTSAFCLFFLRECFHKDIFQSQPVGGTKGDKEKQAEEDEKENHSIHHYNDPKVLKQDQYKENQKS